MIEQLAGIPVEVDYASEYRYRFPLVSPRSLAVAITQSGETADTLAALKADVKALSPGTTIDVSDAKARFGVSRKFAIPLLEYLDRERITRRSGDKRIVI